jgi:hypothetical protein
MNPSNANGPLNIETSKENNNKAKKGTQDFLVCDAGHIAFTSL